MSKDSFKEKEKEKISMKVTDEPSFDASPPADEPLPSMVHSAAATEENVPQLVAGSTHASPTSANEITEDLTAVGACASAPFKSVADKGDAPPDFEGRYEILERIGEGGMGVVYKVFDPSLQKVLAVKVLRANLLEDKQALKRFEKEAEAAAALTHTNLVTVYLHGCLSDGTPYLVMDYVEGENLAQVIEGAGKLETERALKIFQQVLEALECAHEAGLLHRDVKPRNIISVRNENGEERIKLVDFGIAKLMSHSGATTSGVTQTGEFLGSPLYMSPEQCQGEELDQRADLYSAACVLYEMLIGQTPFASNNPVKIVVGHLSEKPASITSSLPESQMIKDIDQILTKCLAKNREHRYQSAAELKQVTADLLAGENPFAQQMKDKRSTLKFLIGIGVVTVLFISHTILTPQTYGFLWSIYDFFLPYAMPGFIGSLVLCLLSSIPIIKAREQGKTIEDGVGFHSLWMVFYMLSVFFYMMIPSVPLDATLMGPYVFAFIMAGVGSVYYLFKYRATAKGSFFKSLHAVRGRSLTTEELIPIKHWRKFLIALTVFFALCFKGPQFEFSSFIGPGLTSLLVAIVLAIFTNRTRARLTSQDKTKPGDRWLMLAGVSGWTASTIYVVSIAISVLAKMQTIPDAFGDGMKTFLVICFLPAMMLSMVFLSVWANRRSNIAPFGKSDGW